MKHFNLCFWKRFIVKDGVLVKYRGKEARVVIPDTVTAIGDHAFSGNTELVEVVAPDDVTEIKDFAFFDCKKLEKVHSVGFTQIGIMAFGNCKNLRKISLPNIEVIYDQAFTNCRNLEEVIFPERQFCIANGVFKGCDKLADKEGFIVLRKMLFDYIGNDPHIRIPDGVQFIGSNAFYKRDFLETVICPDSVSKIMSHAFEWCKNVRAITILNKETEIEERAFDWCKRNMTIRAPKGSYAQQYFEENYAKFETI